MARRVCMFDIGLLRPCTHTLLHKCRCNHIKQVICCQPAEMTSSLRSAVRFQLKAVSPPRATKIFYLMLGLLQIPTGPQRKPQTMADLRLVLSPSQLLSEPQACQKEEEEVDRRERERRVKIIQAAGRLLGIFQSNRCKRSVVLMF